MRESVFTVCIPSAGSGTRMGTELPKQYLLIAGKPVLAYTLAVFDAMPQCLRIVIATDDRRRTERMLADYPLATETVLVDGGPMRQDSVANMLTVCLDEEGILLIHDAARPCITAAEILAVVRAVEKHGSAILALPSRDTVKLVGDGCVERTLDRRSIWMAQTPQGTHASLFLRAVSTARADGYVGTDDAELLERIGSPVAVVEGLPTNMKITVPKDLALAEAILNAQGRVGLVA
jgi:2-C-methyl-D-erythritol 4-phosphate cytidylyltransferase